MHTVVADFKFDLLFRILYSSLTFSILLSCTFIFFLLSLSLSLSLPQSATHVDVSGGKDLHKEYARQREHMERTVASLRKKLTKDSEIHRSDTVRVMQVIIIITRNNVKYNNKLIT